MKRKSRACGKYPTVLYRFFDQEEYALDFVRAGILRAGALYSYKTIECKHRMDDSEGDGHYKVNGKVISGYFSQSNEEPIWVEEEGVQERHVRNGNKIFLYCCTTSLENLECKKLKFGNFIVKIHNPSVFVKELDYSLNGLEGEGNYLIYGSNVEYNKGDLLEDDQVPEQRTDLAYIQKPSRFIIEDEFRYCLIYISSLDLNQNEIYIKVNNTSSFAELLMD